MPACTLLHMHMDGGTCHRDAERQRKENRDRPKIRGKGEEGREEGEEEEKKEEEKFYFLSRWKLRVTMPGECSTWHRPGIPWDFPSLPPSLPPFPCFRPLPIPAALWSTSCGWKSKLRSISPDDTERGKVPLPLPPQPSPPPPPHTVERDCGSCRARALILDVA